MISKNINIILILTFSVCLLVSWLFVSVDGKAQYVEPLNSGLQMTVPYDIANIFIRPIGSLTAIFLSIAMLCILLFGVITSPFGYMFGIPSRKYVLGGPTDVLHSQVASRSFSADSYDYSNLNDTVLNLNQDEYDAVDMGNSSNSNSNWNSNFNSEWEVVKHLEFENSALFLLSDLDKECNLLLVCYAHGVIKKLPMNLIKIYRFFSRKLLNADKSVQNAVRVGLSGFRSCEKNYSTCPYDPFKLTIKTIRSIFPQMW